MGIGEGAYGAYEYAPGRRTYNAMVKQKKWGGNIDFASEYTVLSSFFWKHNLKCTKKMSFCITFAFFPLIFLIDL